MIALMKTAWIDNRFIQRLRSIAAEPKEQSISTSETYVVRYFIPEILIKTLLLIPVTCLFGLLIILQVGGVGPRFVQSVIFTLAALRTCQGVSRICSGRKKTVLAVGPQGIVDSRFGAACIQWSAIDRIDMTAHPEIRPLPGNLPIARVTFRGILRLLVASGIYGNINVPGDLSLSEHRDKRSIRIWLRVEEHIEQTTPAARLRIRDNADGTQRISIAVDNLSMSRGDILKIIARFYEEYGKQAESEPAAT